MSRKHIVCKYLLVVFLSLLLVLNSCGTPNEVVVDASDNDGEVALENGQTLIVTLGSNPSTGYRWEVLEIDETILEQQGEAVFESAEQQDPPKVGVGGTETFRFKAISRGVLILKLVYHRTWEDVEPADTFTVEVRVR